MSISTDGGSDAQSPNCPDCGDDLDYEIITEDGTRRETTKYAGWWCRNCVKGMTHCGACDSLHHPDHECIPLLHGRVREAYSELSGMAEIPGEGTIPIDECELNGQGCAVFRKDDCPMTDCDGDHLYILKHDQRFLDGQFPTPEYTTVAERCSEFDHQDDDACSFHKP